MSVSFMHRGVYFRELFVTPQTRSHWIRTTVKIPGPGESKKINTTKQGRTQSPLKVRKDVFVGKVVLRPAVHTSLRRGRGSEAEETDDDNNTAREGEAKRKTRRRDFGR